MIEEQENATALNTNAAIGREYSRDDLNIGSFEQKVLVAINGLRQDAWGSKLQEFLSKAMGRDVSIAQLYLALARLEQKGLVSSSTLDPEPRRGGRSKKVFRLETPGVRALERTAAELNALGASMNLELHHHGDIAK